MDQDRHALAPSREHCAEREDKRLLPAIRLQDRYVVHRMLRHRIVITNAVIFEIIGLPGADDATYVPFLPLARLSCRIRQGANDEPPPSP